MCYIDRPIISRQDMWLYRYVVTRLPTLSLFIFTRLTPLDMAPKNDTRPDVLCAERISLLFLLHTVPCLPSRTPLESRLHHEQGYTLTLNEERRLVESLAYLANDKEDTNHIPALCVQESAETSSFQLLLAVNRIDWQDGDRELQRLRVSYDNIIAQLSDGERGMSSQHTVLSANIIEVTKSKVPTIQFSQRSSQCAEIAYSSDCALHEVPGPNQSSPFRASSVRLSNA